MLSPERPAEQTIGTQLLKTLVEHTIDDITYDQMNKIVYRLSRMSVSERHAPRRLADVLLEELGAEKSVKYIEKAFAMGSISASDYYALRGFITLPLPRAEIARLPRPSAGIGSQQLIEGQKKLQQEFGKLSEAGKEALQAPFEALNKDVQRLRRAWGL